MLILEQMSIFFFMLMLGVIGKWLKIVTPEIRQSLTKIVVNIVTPCMIISCDISSVIAEDMSFILHAMAVMIGVQLAQVASGILVPILMHYPKEQRGTVNLLFSCTNILLLGIPLVGSLYGSVALVYMSIAIVFNNVMLFSYGVIVIGGGKDKVSFRALATNPSFISSVLLIVFIFAGFNMPDLCREGLSRAGAAAPVLAMIIVGSAVPEIDFKASIRDVRLMIFVAVKMFIVPAVLLLTMQIFLTSRDFEGVALVSIAGPSGVMTAVLASLYNPKMIAMAARACSVTTAIAVFSIPLVALVTGIGL